MAIKKYKPTSPARRFMSVSTYEEITTTTPERSLLAVNKKTGGRNASGKITVRHIGGGNRTKYRIIDFKRDKTVPANFVNKCPDIEHGSDERIFTECREDSMAVCATLGSSGIQNCQDTSIAFCANQSASTLPELDDHLRNRICLHEIMDAGATVFLLLHGMGSQRERQPDDDHRGENISGAVHTLPHTAGCKQHTIPALFELGDGIPIASAHLNQRVIRQIGFYDFVDNTEHLIGCKEYSGAPTGGTN